MEAPSTVNPLTACWIIGHGLLGSALAERLRCSGERVLTVDCSGEADITGDAAEPSVLLKAGAVMPPQTVFCCQSTRGGDAAAYRRVYLSVAEALYTLFPQVRVVMCSSVSVYGAVQGCVSEDVLPVEPGERAAVLLETEALVLRRGGVVARLAPLYGNGRCEVLRRYLVGEPMLAGSPERLLNYVHVADAAAALHLLAQVGGGGVYNVCGETRSKDELYQQFRRIFGDNGVMTSAECSRRGVSNRRIDCSRLRNLGWSPAMNLREYARQSTVAK